MARNYVALPYEYFEEMEVLSDADFGRLIRALMVYSMTGEPIEIDGAGRFFTKRVMNQEDRFRGHYSEISKKRSEAGRTGAESRWNGKSMANDSKAMANDGKAWQDDDKNGYTKTETNTNTKPIEKKYTPKSPEKKSSENTEIDKTAKQVVDYLNVKIGTRYRYSESSLRHIRARLNEGFSLEDCQTVIDKKSGEWKDDPDMAKYLRPETLFGSKFENYLNAPASKGFNYGKKQDLLPDYYNPDPFREGSNEKMTEEELEHLKQMLQSTSNGGKA